MTRLTARRAADLITPAPSTPCVTPALASALTDRSFVFDGSPEWTVEHASRMLAHQGVERPREAAASALAVLSGSMEPVPPDWLADRLALLWTLFMASRAVASSDAVTIWTSEHLRLLGDLPHDVVGHAIDQAVKSCRHGFIPSVGEIRSIAEPMVAERRQRVQRLEALLNHFEDRPHDR